LVFRGRQAGGRSVDLSRYSVEAIHRYDGGSEGERVALTDGALPVELASHEVRLFRWDTGN